MRKDPEMDLRRKAAAAMYATLNDGLKEDLFDALIWAKNTLARKEGPGHDIHLHATKLTQMQCSFAKPEWAGDHCGTPMDTAPEAILMSVCEYLSGC